ncbi:MAG: prenyltransferase [Candidatus Bathyarchaeota archaeon]|nr:prenyltransferase [Candidatus Bathyarchaeota archaeon]
MGSLSTLHVCLRVVRPHIVAGGFLGYSLGVLLALLRGGAFDPAVFAIGYAVVFFGDLSTHFSNDYFDADLEGKASRKAFGGSNALAVHPEARPLAVAAAVALSALSLLTASAMVLRLGFPPVLLVLATVTNILGWLYSTPPFMFNARGIGEATIAFGTGLAVPAVGYLVTRGMIDRHFIAFSAPLMLYGFILSLALELPDLEVDRDGGRRNLVVLLGRRRVSFVVFLLSVAATVAFVLLAAVNPGNLWPLPLFSALPLAAGLMGLLRRSDSQLEADRISALNISALFLFLVALDGYLLISLL